MSVLASSWVWEHSKAKGTARLVLLSLADHAGADGGDAYPSVARLARRCGVSTRTVQEALKVLTSLGELVIEPQAGPRGANRYQLVMTPADLAPPQDLHPAGSAPRPPQDLPLTPQILHPTPADPAPEPSLNRQGTVLEPSALGADLESARDHRTPAQRFPDFWAVYPLQSGQPSAKSAWKRAVQVASPDEIIAGAIAYRDDPRRNPDMTARPCRWLDDHRWLDKPAAPAPSRQNKSMQAIANVIGLDR